MLTWTEKERTLIQDLKGQEQLCVDKYTRHASSAKDPQLKNLFSQLAKNEQQHLDSLRTLEQGSVPQTGGGSGSSSKMPQSFDAVYGGASQEKQDDCYLCTDVLSGEKHASHLYDTCVFEFQNKQVRDVLNHIQKEEQEHGKLIYDYMKANGMYQ